MIKWPITIARYTCTCINATHVYYDKVKKVCTVELVEEKDNYSAYYKHIQVLTHTIRSTEDSQTDTPDTCIQNTLLYWSCCPMEYTQRTHNVKKNYYCTFNS